MESEFGALKAANFGAQGTQPRSLPWRMRNGELEGYEAKLVVLQAWNIAEIRARQPQAKLLIIASLPRGFMGLEQWRQRAESVEAGAGLRDLGGRAATVARPVRSLRRRAERLH